MAPTRVSWPTHTAVKRAHQLRVQAAVRRRPVCARSTRRRRVGQHTCMHNVAVASIMTLCRQASMHEYSLRVGGTCAQPPSLITPPAPPLTLTLTYPPPGAWPAHHLAVAPHVAVKGHVLDEAHVDGALARERHKVRQLVVVDATHDHHVDLHSRTHAWARAWLHERVAGLVSTCAGGRAASVCTVCMHGRLHPCGGVYAGSEPYKNEVASQARLAGASHAKGTSGGIAVAAAELSRA